MSRLVLSFILVGLLIWSGSAQQTTSLKVSIKVDDPVLQRGRVTVVHTKIKWGSVANAKPETLRAVSLQLIKTGASANRCTRGNCIGATFSLPVELTPKPGEVVEFDVVLNDLYWNDVISSQLDISQPKNLFVAVPVGSYSLVLSTGFRANYSTKRDPRVIQVASNSVPVQMSQ